jgi:Rrf2 family transcriptional regulator, iron-sulfur cluster assembly transcription factor
VAAKRGQVLPAELLQSPLYSHNCRDALKVMERLAASSLDGRAVQEFSRVAADTGLSVPAVMQVAHFLQRAKLVKPQGIAGVALARSPAAISMLDVVRAIDGSGPWKRCLLGLAQCSDEAPCPAHFVWKRARGMLERQLEKQSIADLAQAILEKGRRRMRPAPTKRGSAKKGGGSGRVR